jgi:hypothetical protein
VPPLCVGLPLRAGLLGSATLCGRPRAPIEDPTSRGGGGGRWERVWGVYSSQQPPAGGIPAEEDLPVIAAGLVSPAVLDDGAGRWSTG